MDISETEILRELERLVGGNPDWHNLSSVQKGLVVKYVWERAVNSDLIYRGDQDFFLTGVEDEAETKGGIRRTLESEKAAFLLGASIGNKLDLLRQVINAADIITVVSQRRQVPA